MSRQFLFPLKGIKTPLRSDFQRLPVLCYAKKNVSPPLPVCWDATNEERTIAERGSLADGQFEVQIVQWYPGHIAKAERQLKEQLSMVDVIIEVRDARVPLSTTHPSVAEWCHNKPRLVVMNRVDMISNEDKQEWTTFWSARKQKVFFTDGKSGQGCEPVVKAMLRAGQLVNERRSRRGLAPRSVRAVMIGFPNVGKSALINRLVKRRAVESANKPGVTRTLRWVTVGEGIDLLDAPGVIPMRLDDQIAAARLAMVNDIGEASYINSTIAGSLLARFRGLPNGRNVMARVEKRYNMRHGESWDMTCEDLVWRVADDMFQGDLEKAGVRILGDYRSGRLGIFALEIPPAGVGPTPSQ